MNKSIFKELFLLIIGFAAIGIAAYFIYPYFRADIDIDYPIEQEEQLGKYINEILDKKFKYLSNPTLDSAMNVIEKRLFDALETTDYEYQIKIINESQVNAFAIPGAYIYVYSGLLEQAENAEELAAVLGHEIGHIEERHIAQKLIKELGIALIITMSSGGDNVMLSDAYHVATSAFDREMEKESDVFSMKLLVKAGISPKVIATFFRKIRKLQSEMVDYLEIINSHPNTNSRIKAALEYELPENFTEKRLNVNWDRVIQSIQPAGQKIKP